MTQPQTELPSWSLQSAGAAAPNPAAVRRGRPEEGQEQVRFAAAMSRASDAARPPASQIGASESAGNEAFARLPSRPEERHSDEAAVGVRNDNFFGEDGFGVADLIDIVNPLQHIPGVSTVYRALTGDEISQGARLAGGTLYGGPLGFASALADNVSEDVTGRDVGGSVLAAFSDEPADAGNAMADAGGAEAAGEEAARLAAIEPASGAPRPVPVADNPAVMQAAMQSAPSPAPSAASSRSQASPLMAAQPVGSPFAAQPSGNSPMAVLRPPGAPNVLDGGGQPAMARSVPPESPATAAAQGVPTLSPEAANVLMRMSQQPQANAAPQAPMAAPPPKIAPAPVPAPSATSTAPAPPPAVEPSTASATAQQGATRPQTAAFFDAVPAEDLPAAMMEALQRYESMKQ